MKILLLSYSCDPTRGSEAGIGWRWVAGLAREHEVTVLTHPRGLASINQHLAEHPNPNIRVQTVEIPRFLDNWPEETGEHRIHTKYVLWQFWMYATARKLVRKEHFDLVHHVSWITMTGPTLGWALGRPFIWGPVGSGQKAPLNMRRHLGTKGWIKEAIRNMQVATVGLNPLARLTVRNSAAAIASNLDTHAALRKLGAKTVYLIHDSAVDDHWVPAEYPERPARNKPVILWLGRLEARKAPGLAIEAFARMRAEHEAELWIIGEGSLKEASRSLARQVGVEEDVTFWGSVPHKTVPDMLKSADVFLFTSLRDTFPTVVLEAMALGLPGVALNHHGLRTLTDDAVSKIEVTDPETVVDDLAKELGRLVANPELRRQRGIAAWENVRKEHLWSHRYQQMQEVYENVQVVPRTSMESLAHGHPS